MVPEISRIQNRLTDRTLRALKPDPLRPYDVADGADLYVRVETSGTVVFWLRYQLNGKRRRWVIGHYGTGKAGISLTDARDKRDEANKLLRDGIDPWNHEVANDFASARAREQEEDAERRRVHLQTQTVAWLVDQFCTIELPAQHKNPKWGEQLLRTHIEKRLSTVPLSALTTNKLWECLDPLRAGQPATARHVYGLAKKLTAFGLQRGYLEHDPAASIQRRAVAPKPPPRQRVLSDDEIRAQDGLQAQHFAPRPRPERNAIGARRRLQGRERAIGLGLGQVGHAPLFDEVASARQ